MSYQRTFSMRGRMLAMAALGLAGSLATLAADPIAPELRGSGPVLAAVNTSDLPVADTTTSTKSAPAAPSPNATINLINRLVERGILTKEDSADLIKQAEADAAQAKAQAAAVQAASAQAASAQAAAQSVPLALAPEVAPMPPSSAESAPPPTDDQVRVTYVPEIVKAQMRDEIKKEVLDQAKAENWAAPRMVPEWVSRIKLFGDLRVRYQGDFFPDGNDNTGAFPNFNAINTGAPFDVAGTTFSPQNNVDQDRNRIRLRARVGVDVDLRSGFSAGIRLGTGETNSPVTENQTLGVANNGQGGNFSKYAIWLDRAFLKYELGGQPSKNLALTLGRFDNPFFSTSMIFADDLGFDGAAIQARYEVIKNVTPFVTGGAFPIFNTDFNFSSNQPSKFRSEDKWLLAEQVGTDWKINKDLSTKVAVGYYDFQNVQGQLSDPFTPLTSSDQGDTDDTRPAFAQKGNTYRALRDIVPTVNNNFGTTNQFQYFGLATPFRVLTTTGRLDYDHFAPVRLSLIGEYARNLAFQRDAIEAIAVNNRGTTNALGSVAPFAGGDTAWIVNFKIGSASLEKLWDWNLGLGYRYVESDAVIDGFCDSDFGGGGTNLKGYTVGGSLALSPYVTFGLRWMSATQVAGPPFKQDVLQVDFNGKF